MAPQPTWFRSIRRWLDEVKPIMHQAHELLDGAIPLTEKAVHLLVVVAGFLLLAVTIAQLLKGKLS